MRRLLQPHIIILLIALGMVIYGLAGCATPTTSGWEHYGRWTTRFVTVTNTANRALDICNAEGFNSPNCVFDTRARFQAMNTFIVEGNKILQTWAEELGKDGTFDATEQLSALRQLFDNLEDVIPRLFPPET